MKNIQNRFINIKNNKQNNIAPYAYAINYEQSEQFNGSPI